MPKSPMMTGTSPRPSSQRPDAEGESKSSADDVLTDLPQSRPTAAIMSAFTIDSRAKYVSSVRPRTMRAKYSGGPKLR